MSRIRQLMSAGVSCWLIVAASAFVDAQEIKVKREFNQNEVPKPGGARRVSTLIGASVYVQNNLSVGKIDDLVINENGCVDYLVILNEDKYVLVPWSAAAVDFGQRTVVVEIAREKFREVPTFTRERWPDLQDRVYVEKLRTYYGVTPGRERRIERRDDRKRP